MYLYYSENVIWDYCMHPVSLCNGKLAKAFLSVVRIGWFSYSCSAWGNSWCKTMTEIRDGWRNMVRTIMLGQSGIRKSKAWNVCEFIFPRTNPHHFLWSNYEPCLSRAIAIRNRTSILCIPYTPRDIHIPGHPAVRSRSNILSLTSISELVQPFRQRDWPRYNVIPLTA